MHDNNNYSIVKDELIDDADSGSGAVPEYENENFNLNLPSTHRFDVNSRMARNRPYYKLQQQQASGYKTSFTPANQLIKTQIPTATNGGGSPGNRRIGENVRCMLLTQNKKASLTSRKNTNGITMASRGAVTLTSGNNSLKISNL